MELTKKTISELQRLVNDNLDNPVGLNYMCEIMGLLNEDDYLGYEVNSKYDKNRHSPIYAYSKDFSIHISPKYLKEYIKPLVEEYIKTYPEVEEVIMYNYVVMFMILHEVAHLGQFNSFTNAKYVHEEIARAYYLFFNVASKSILSKIKLRVNPLKDFTERNANINASRLLNKIYAGSLLESVSKDDYIDYLLMGYKSTCPIEETYTLLELPYAFDTRGMWLDQKLEVGFKVDRDDLKKVIKCIDGNPKANVEEIDKKILSLG